MAANYEDSLRREAALATATLASRTADEELWTILQTSIATAREADERTLSARITSLIADMIAETAATTARADATERAELLTTLAEMRGQSDARDQTSSGAVDALTCEVRLLQELRYGPSLPLRRPAAGIDPPGR